MVYMYEENVSDVGDKWQNSSVKLVNMQFFQHQHLIFIHKNQTNYFIVNVFAGKGKGNGARMRHWAAWVEL